MIETTSNRITVVIDLTSIKKPNSLLAHLIEICALLYSTKHGGVDGRHGDHLEPPDQWVGVSCVVASMLVLDDKC